MGKGVLKAVENVNTKLKDVVMAIDSADQRAIDEAMLAAVPAQETRNWPEAPAIPSL